MSKIDRISHVRNMGVFHLFDWPEDLLAFGRFNLIYGWNGSGKTTISKLLRALEMKTEPICDEVTMSIDGKDFSGCDFNESALSIRVFNRDFVSESVFPVGGGEVPPIFVVGKENVEKQKKIEKLKTILNKVKTDVKSARSMKQDSEKALDQYCVSRASEIKRILRSSGTNPYNNYNKTNFKNKAQDMIERNDREVCSLSDEHREKLFVQLGSIPKPILQIILYKMPMLRQMSDAAMQLLKATVVSTAIQSLKDDPMLSDWVHRGLDLHKDMQSNRCLFCEQSIPKNRMMELEAHFSTEYVRLLERLDEQIHNIRVESKNIEKLDLPKSAELYEDLSVEYETELSSLREALDLAKAFLDDLEKILTEKKGCVFKILDFNVAAPKIDSGCVSRLNAVISTHNSKCENFQKILSDARKSLEDDLVAGSITDFIRLKECAQARDVIITRKARGITNLEKKISHLESEIIEYRKSADELNDDLRKYLGHGELCLVVKDTGYKITRNDAPAHSLSEGEMTAISLLYFLKSLQDRRFDLSNGIVVLDDPVSSLDANALYLAFGLIRERTKDAAQLFIFTHNFAFFREVRTWFHHLDGQRKNNINMRPARFYMLECIRDGDTRCSYIRHLDPLLEQYESEYHYIFACIYRAATSTSSGDLAGNYVLPNMARRLLETFLAFRQPHISGQLYQKLKNIEFDEARKSRILRFLHMHSHSDVVGVPEHDLSILSEAGPVLKDLLEFIKDQDRGHYASMVKLIDPGTEEEDSA